jgi:hypothetical protein
VKRLLALLVLLVAAASLGALAQGGTGTGLSLASALGDYSQIATGTCTASSASISTGSAFFTSTAVDGGKTIFLAGCGASGVVLVTTISSVQSTTAATVVTAASTSVSATSTFGMATDAHAAFNNAIAACNGGTVFVPPGSFGIANEQINMSTNCTLEGSGQASVIYKMGQFDLINGNHANIYIRNLTLVGNSAEFTTAIASNRGISLTSSAVGFAVTDNTFRDMAGVDVYATSSSQGVVDRNFMYGSGTGGGIFMENSTTHVNITNNYIDGTLWTSSNNKDISFHSTSTGKQVSSIIVSHNDLVVGALGMAVEILPSGGTFPTDIVVANNTCIVVANAEECYSLSGLNNSTITGNTADVNNFSLSIACFEVVALNDSTFTGNTCADSTTGSSMSFQGVAFDTITGNHLDTFKAANGNGFYFALPQQGTTGSVTSCSASGSAMTFNFSGTLNGNIYPGAYIYVTGMIPTAYNTPSGILWRVTAITSSSVMATNSITSSLGGNCTTEGTIGLGTVGNTVTGNEIFFPPSASGTLYGMRFDCSFDAGTSCSGNTIANNEFIGTGFSGEVGLYIANLTGSQADTNNVGSNSFRNLGTGIVIGSGSNGNFPTNTFVAPQAMTSVTTPLSAANGTLAESFLPTTFAKLAACTGILQGSLAFVTDSTTQTWGATITGSGSSFAVAVCDGTNWTVMGK